MSGIVTIVCVTFPLTCVGLSYHCTYTHIGYIVDSVGLSYHFTYTHIGYNIGVVGLCYHCTYIHVGYIIHRVGFKLPLYMSVIISVVSVCVSVTALTGYRVIRHTRRDSLVT